MWRQVREDDSQDLPRGTRITLHLKEDAAELADDAKLGSLIKQYSEFIQFPIKLWSSKTEYEQVRSFVCWYFTPPMQSCIVMLRRWDSKMVERLAMSSTAGSLIMKSRVHMVSSGTKCCVASVVFDGTTEATH